MWIVAANHYFQVGAWLHRLGRRVAVGSLHQLAARTRAEAEAEAIDVFRKETGQPTGLTIADLWNRYLAERQGHPVAETMMYTGKAVLAHFGALRADQIEPGTCRSYAEVRDKVGIKPGSVWTELGHLSTVLNWAGKTRLIDHVPLIERPSKPAPKDRYLTRPEIDRLLAAPAEPHIKLAILLMLSTAARVTAILELTWSRVDLDRGQIDLRKSSTVPRKGRAVVPINAGLKEALVKAREAALTDHVVEWAGKPIKSIIRGFNSAVTAAGLTDVSLHVLRHTSAVHMIEAGVPIPQISQYLGHTNASMTERAYARFSPDYLRTAAQVLDFTQSAKLRTKS